MALYNVVSLEKFVNQIAGFVDESEKALPIGAICHKLAEVEIEEAEDVGV
jgi:hypothetical protein